MSAGKRSCGGGGGGGGGVACVILLESAILRNSTDVLDLPVEDPLAIDRVVATSLFSLASPMVRCRLLILARTEFKMLDKSSPSRMRADDAIPLVASTSVYKIERVCSRLREELLGVASAGGGAGKWLETVLSRESSSGAFSDKYVPATDVSSSRVLIERRVDCIGLS